MCSVGAPALPTHIRTHAHTRCHRSQPERLTAPHPHTGTDHTPKTPQLGPQHPIRAGKASPPARRSRTGGAKSGDHSPRAETTHPAPSSPALNPHSQHKPNQSNHGNYRQNLAIIVVFGTRIHRAHNLASTRRGRLIHNAIHSRVRRSRMHNPRRATTACTVQSCLVLVSATRLRGTLVAECFGDGWPGDVALAVGGGDGLSARPGINRENVSPIALTGHLTVHVSARRQAVRRSWLNRTNPQPPRKRDLTPVTPPQVGHAPILLNDERTPRTVPHRPSVPQARPVLLILRLARRSLRHVNGGTRTGEHPPTSRGGLLGRIGGRATHQAHNPKHQGHHHAHRRLAHLTVPFDPPRRRGCVADAQNCTPHEAARVNPRHTTQHVTYATEHTYTQTPTHTRTQLTHNQATTQTPAHTNTHNTPDQHKHQKSRQRNNHTQKNKHQQPQGITPAPTPADRYAS